MTFSGVTQCNKCSMLEREHVIGFGFQHPVAQILFLSSYLKTGYPNLVFTVLSCSGITLVQFDLWDRPRKVHIGELLEGMHLRRDEARPQHMMRENWKPRQNPERDSLWHHRLAGRVLLFLCRSCPSGCVVQMIAMAGGGARTCAKERGVARLSPAARRRMDRRRCIALRSKVMRRW